MISVIICSSNKNLFKKIEANISATIGVPYELIGFDNSKYSFGITHVYNTCSAKAKYNLVCFLHEDIILKTNHWGRIANELFAKNKSLGLLGVAGTVYQPFLPSSWGHPSSPRKILHYVNIVQHFKFSNQEPQHLFSNPFNENLKKVATIDGVFFITTQEVLKHHQFDDQLLKGFHGYDVDFSMSVKKSFDVAVTYDILLEHLSEGKFERDWLLEALKVWEKWSPSLPLNLEDLDVREARTIEKGLLKKILKTMIEFDIEVRRMDKIIKAIKTTSLASPAFNMKLHYYYKKAKIKQMLKNLSRKKTETKLSQSRF